MITCDTPPANINTSKLPLPLREGDGGRGDADGGRSSTPPCPTPTPGPLRNGNPRGNPNLAPRCGAKSRRTGNPCRAPAMPNGRCRMHGGKCTGPRTKEGKASTAAAHTTHGYFTADRREYHRYIRTLIRRNRLLCAARLLWRYLPPDMAARLAEAPVELSAPIHPSNLPFLTPEQARLYNVTAALDRARGQSATGHAGKPPPPTVHAYERAATHVEAATQAPWRQAIAIARANKRADRAARRQARAARQAAHATKRAARPTATAQPTDPNPQESQLSLLEREHAARLVGLRPGRHPQTLDPTTTSETPDSTRSELNPLQREPTPNRSFPPPELNPLQRETGPIPGRPSRTASVPTYLTPTKAAALRTTTLAGTWDPNLRSALATRFGHPSLARRISLAWPPIAGAGTAKTVGCDNARNHALDISAPPRPWPC